MKYSSQQENISDQFYTQISPHKEELSELVQHSEYFVAVPESWQVVITDIKKSTLAVESGSQEVVNLIASGSIIAALNIAYQAKTFIPFFFGGDGATLLIPPSLLSSTMDALNQHRSNTLRNYELDLRVGNIPVKTIYEAGHRIQIAKAKLNSVFTIPIVLGEGLGYAESLVKGEDKGGKNAQNGNALNLEGMECRWDRIKPPQPTQEVVCLLVQAHEEFHQSKVYGEVLAAIDQIYGPQQNRKPISVPRLKLRPTLSKLQNEMQVKLGKYNLSYLVKNWLITAFGPIYIRYIPKGRNYLNLLVELSDTLVIDGRINTVISGTPEQRKELEATLKRLEAQGDMVFGIYNTNESIMSCYVRGRDEEHIHFIDGAGGGYTQAARMLKGKLNDK